MATVAVPTAGDPVRASWGEDVADAINNTHDDRLPFVNALGLENTANQSTQYAVSTVSAGNAGCIIVPFYVPTSMELVGYSFFNNDTSGAHTAEFRLYKDTGSTTLTEVAGSDATISFTPSAVDIRHATLTSGNIVIPPGVYWLAIRNTSSSVSLDVGGTSNTTSWSGSDNYVARTAGATVPSLGTTLDVSGFSTSNRTPLARLDGAVFGEATAF